MRLLTYISFIYLWTSCSAQKAGLKSTYFKNKSEVLEYQQITYLNDTLIKEKKVLWNINGRMSWCDSLVSKKENYNSFNFAFNIIRDTVFIEYTNTKATNQRLAVFPLKVTDTLECINFDELQNNNIQYTGQAYYNGSKKITVVGKEIQCYSFKINEGFIRSNTKKEKIKEYYLSKKELIPIFIKTSLIITKTGKVDSTDELILSKVIKD